MLILSIRYQTSQLLFCMFLCFQQSYHALIIDMRQLSSDGDICASVSHDALAAPTFPIAVGKPPHSYSSLSFSFSLSVSLPTRQLGHQGLQERVSPWWNRCRQLFLQPQGHYLKSDRDSSEWTWERWETREGEEGKRDQREGEQHSGKKERGCACVCVGGGGWGGTWLCRCIVQRRERVLGDKWIQQAFGTHRRLLIDPDRSIQAGWREGWEFSEGVNNLAAQLSCPIHQRQRPNQGWIPLSVWGGGPSPPPSLSALASLSVSPSLLPSPHSSLCPQPLTSTPSELWKWLKWQPIERG